MIARLYLLKPVYFGKSIFSASQISHLGKALIQGLGVATNVCVSIGCTIMYLQLICSSIFKWSITWCIHNLALNNITCTTFS